MAKTKPSFLTALANPAFTAGFFCVLFLFGCQPTTPEDVTIAFWQALAQGQLDKAKSQTTKNTQAIVNIKDIDKHSPINIGEIVADDMNASVLTTINRNNKPVTFNTVLLKEENHWKVDFQQTHSNIAMVPFEGIAKSLQDIGEAFTNQIEQQIPLIEKEMESLGNEIKGEIDKFGQTLKKPNPPANPKNRPGTN
ncbi:hypothetical protein MCAMS1_01148 [biofilm metagenome]